MGESKMTYLEKLKKINLQRDKNEFAERICAEITYLDGISKNNSEKYNADIEAAVDYLLASVEENGVITKKTAMEAEEMLIHLSSVAKSYHELFVSHAHIDMNWMWGYNETAAITVDTFRTILDLMREYPGFTFAQSQASTYEIIEKFRPDMLEEIKARIHEGRWEVTATEWVEPDKNIPDGESLTRQILQSKKYLSKLLEIPEESLCVDFVPDTFGHNANIPEVLANAGVKYMYHCRGFEGPMVYNFVAPSGKRVLNYKEYVWYNGEITTYKFEIVPEFCRQVGVDTYLCVYGVGDHGGGPSRRDIERILKYRSWPLTPDIRFGTFREFFDILAQDNHYPDVQQELNCIFTGCYTTQSRIKMSNRISEARINEAEVLSAEASVLADAPKDQGVLDAPWRNILFNHFHDILPGSGTVETREYAMGRFQETLASVSTYASRAMYAIAERIDTSGITFDTRKDTVSEGGGTGFYQSQNAGFQFPMADRGRGAVRAIHVFNTTAYDRDEVTEVTVWDYPYDLSLVAIVDANDKPVDFCISESGNGYWGHTYTKIQVRAKVPAFGYTTLILRQKADNGHVVHKLPIDPRSDEYINDEPLVLENAHIKAVFEANSLCLVSLTDKETGKELISEPSCYFRYADENPRYGMTSWRVGPYMHTVNLNREYNVKLYETVTDPVLSKLSYELKFGASVIKVSIILKKNSRVLEYALNIDWNEAAVPGEKIPQISFAVPVSYCTTGKGRYDIPYGEVERVALAHDVPALSYLAMDGEEKNCVGIVSDSKYGYRYNDKCGSVTLIRSAYDPDPYPDRGIHTIRLGVMVAPMQDMRRQAQQFNHPMPFVAGTCKTGSLPLESGFLKVQGNVDVSCVKNAEAEDGVVVRVFDRSGTAQTVRLCFLKAVQKAYITDSNEKVVAETQVCDGTAEFAVDAYATVTVKVIF